MAYEDLKSGAVVPYPKFDGTQACAGDVRFTRDIPSSGIGQKIARELTMTCQFCAFIEPCARWGLRHEPFGVVGGMTARQRDALRREHRIPLSVPEIIADPAMSRR